MFRAEQMLSLSGPIKIEGKAGERRVVNGADIELRDAVLVDLSESDEPNERWLGTIAPGGSVAIDGPAQAGAAGRMQSSPGPDVGSYLAELRATWEPTDENRGELRLVAWTADPTQGQVVEPAVDRHRGFTAVVVHLSGGTPPSPDGRRYNRLAITDPQLEARYMEELKRSAQRAVRNQATSTNRGRQWGPTGRQPKVNP